MTTRNNFTQERRGSAEVSGIDLSNGDGSFTVTVGELRRIESVADVTVEASGGYVANADSVSGNTVTATLYETAGSNGEMASVGDGSDITGIRVEAAGY